MDITTEYISEVPPNCFTGIKIYSNDGQSFVDARLIHDRVTVNFEDEFPYTFTESESTYKLITIMDNLLETIYLGRIRKRNYPFGNAIYEINIAVYRNDEMIMDSKVFYDLASLELAANLCEFLLYTVLKYESIKAFRFKSLIVDKKSIYNYREEPIMYEFNSIQDIYNRDKKQEKYVIPLLKHSLNKVIHPQDLMFLVALNRNNKQIFLYNPWLARAFYGYPTIYENNLKIVNEKNQICGVFDCIEEPKKLVLLSYKDLFEDDIGK